MVNQKVKLSILIVASVIIVLIGTTTYCSNNNIGAVIGVTKANLSANSDLKSDGPDLQLGTKISVLKDEGAALEVRLENSKVYWCHRAYICTPDELEIRRKKGQIPKGVTFMGLNDDGTYKLYGFLNIENNRVVLLPGQGIWFDNDLCQKKGDMEWSGSSIQLNVNAVYFLLEKGLIELPAWPNNRKKTTFFRNLKNINSSIIDSLSIDFLDNFL